VSDSEYLLRAVLRAAAFAVEGWIELILEGSATGRPGLNRLRTESSHRVALWSRRP
jgi:hypothetical protein